MQSEVEKMIHTETLTYDEVSLGRAPGLVINGLEYPERSVCVKSPINTSPLMPDIF